MYLDDIGILRQLGMRLSEIASLPIQQDRKRQWIALNALKPERSMFLNPEDEKTSLRRILAFSDKFNCPTEFILKDISTVSHRPQTVWEWAIMMRSITGE